MSYYGSTDPQSVAGASGVQNYTNFAGVNTPVFKSTGTVTITGDQTITGGFAVTGNVEIIDAVSAIAGSTTLATTADLDNTNFQAVTSTSGVLKKYLLETPVAGAIKRILCNAEGAGDIYIYASASSAYTAYFGGNTSQNVLSLTTPDFLYFELVGVSTAQWLLTQLSTLNNGTTGTVTIASSNS